MVKYIPLSECKKGYVYEIDSRNLSYGVFNGKDGFIGIREKFDNRYLFTEYHWDTGAPFGTVRPLREIGPLEDEHISLSEFYPSRCYYCGFPLERTDTGWRHSLECLCEKAYAVAEIYKPLFDYLEELEEEERERKKEGQGG